MQNFPSFRDSYHILCPSTAEVGGRSSEATQTHIEIVQVTFVNICPQYTHQRLLSRQIEAVLFVHGFTCQPR